MCPCTSKSDEENSTYAGLPQENGFSPTYFAQVAEAGKKRSKTIIQLLEKSVINMISLLLPVFDWSIIMIGPGGLLLVSSYLFAVPL
jgi:hypothetical protein